MIGSLADDERNIPIGYKLAGRPHSGLRTAFSPSGYVSPHPDLDLGAGGDLGRVSAGGRDVWQGRRCLSLARQSASGGGFGHSGGQNAARPLSFGGDGRLCRLGGFDLSRRLRRRRTRGAQRRRWLWRGGRVRPEDGRRRPRSRGRWRRGSIGGGSGAIAQARRGFRSGAHLEFTYRLIRPDVAAKALVEKGGNTRTAVAGRYPVLMPIPMKPPVCNGMIAPRDSWMMPPPCNEMIPPGAPRLLA